MKIRDEHFRDTMLLMAIGFSIFVVTFLFYEGISTLAILLTASTYVFWWISSRLGSEVLNVTSPDKSRHDVSVVRLASDSTSHTVDQYYARLFGSLEYGWARFQSDHDHGTKALHSVDVSLGKALDMAHSTGLLAANAMMSAAQCGEVGRGFVTVSKDLIGVSEQSGQDMSLLRRSVRNFLVSLSRCKLLVEYPIEFWLVSSAGLPIAELVKLRTELLQLQKELNRIGERYRRTSQADVRWLQLGDAVKRLLSELVNTLYQLELHLQDVLSDMRLLQLSQESRQQIVEIKDRMHLQTRSEGASEKFIF